VGPSPKVRLDCSFWKAITNCFSCIFSSLSSPTLSSYFPITVTKLSQPSPKLFTARLIGKSIWPLIYKLPFSTFPRLFPSLISCRQQPFFKILQKQSRTGRRQFWEHPSPVPSSFQTPTKIVTQTFTDLSLHCYHCRKTQQLHAGKGHTSERPVSTCLIFVNFFFKFSSKFHFCFGSPLFLFVEKRCRTVLGKVT
jgi:hypothetical protein